MMNAVSVIICVRNSADTLRMCLESIVGNCPYEIIVVDGNSTDGSYQIALEYANKVLQDPGRGLSYARGLGVEAARTEYILHLGPDNVLPVNAISGMMSELVQHNYHGIGARTRVVQRDTVWDKWLDDWWQYARPEPGPRAIIGTPCLFPKKVLLKVPFSEKPIMCDDTDLCERLTKLGYRLGLASVVIYDASRRNWRDIVTKFVNYGRSDADYYDLHSPSWVFKRKFQSWCHPLRQTGKGMGWMVRNNKPILSILFQVIIGMIRYYGWIKTAIARHGWLIKR